MHMLLMRGRPVLRPKFSCESVSVVIAGVSVSVRYGAIEMTIINIIIKSVHFGSVLDAKFSRVSVLYLDQSSYICPSCA